MGQHIRSLPGPFATCSKGEKKKKDSTNLFGKGHNAARSNKPSLLTAQYWASASCYTRSIRCRNHVQSLLFMQELLSFLAISLSVFCQARLKTAQEERRGRKMSVIRSAIPHDPAVPDRVEIQTLAGLKALQFHKAVVLLSQLKFLLLLWSLSTFSPTSQPLTKKLWKF